GPGRGSAAGSLVAYVLGITDVDPLKYGLLFERFLNPSRVSMPDIDIDFDDERRNEVLDYVIQKYGRDNVAQIITFGTMAARAAVRDVGRAIGYPYDEVDRLAKLVPPPIQGRHILLEKSIRDDPELRKTYEKDARAKNLLDNAIRLEGTVRHAGTHACAVVIAPEPLTKYTPLQKSTDGEGVITQYSMKPLDELGLLKVDFLGLKNLTIIRETLTTIERFFGEKIDLAHISLEDKKTFSLLAKGDTTGVFQLESSGMRRYLKELEPTSLNDIIAMVSLYRPGPMPWIPMYIRGKHDPKSVAYLHPLFESILKETYGVALYQEQILKIARDFSGFSLGEADILRKAVGKKDPKLLAGEREKFVNGAVAKGQSRKLAENVFDK
ncbi:DNA polymerase III subunit alpha, partial [Candidatus Peregrinibacteria bacterium]|nr:DNA polymerase III subunit alpha [Candidatus Peregrinibacteria bacterium]